MMITFKNGYLLDFINLQEDSLHRVERFRGFALGRKDENLRQQDMRIVRTIRGSGQRTDVLSIARLHGHDASDVFAEEAKGHGGIPVASGEPSGK